MENRFVIYIVLAIFFIQVSNSQEAEKYHEAYTFLSRTEYDRVLDIGAEKLLEGNYYIVDNKKNISIKRYTKGIKNGEWISFNALFNGLKLTSTINYSNGKLHGYFFRTDNHTYSEEGYYKNEVKFGTWTKKFFSDKDEIEIIRYNNKGKRHGEYSKINLEFEEKEIISYKNGKKDGKYYLENKKYKTTVKGHYKNNLKQGLWVFKDEYLTKIDEDGSEEASIRKEYYKKGILVKKE